MRGGADGDGWVAEVDGFFCILVLRVEVENRLFDFVIPSLKQIYNFKHTVSILHSRKHYLKTFKIVESSNRAL